MKRNMHTRDIKVMLSANDACVIVNALEFVSSMIEPGQRKWAGTAKLCQRIRRVTDNKARAQ